MKINQLLESFESLEQELRQEKYKGFSQGIERLLNRDWTITRGSNHYPENTITINQPRVNRKPANAKTMFYYHAFRNLEPWKSLPERSVICADRDRAKSGFGRNFIIIPKNDTIICKLPDDDLWFSFKGEHHLPEGLQFYDLETVCRFLERLITKLTGSTITTENFLKLLNMASKIIEDDPSILDRYELSEFYNDSSINLEDAVKGYFRDVIIEVTNVENFKSDDTTNEVWFSSEYLTIPWDMYSSYHNSI